MTSMSFGSIVIPGPLVQRTTNDHQEFQVPFPWRVSKKRYKCYFGGWIFPLSRIKLQFI